VWITNGHIRVMVLFTTGWRRLVVVDSCMDTADMETRYLSATTDEEVSYGCLA